MTDNQDIHDVSDNSLLFHDLLYSDNPNCYKQENITIEAHLVKYYELRMLLAVIA